MKTLKSYFKILTTLIIGVFMIMSCENSSDMTDEVQSISEEETLTLIESNDINDEVDDIIDEVIAEEFGIAGKEEAAKNDNPSKNGRPDCAVKTIEIKGTTVSMTLDFGDGCEMKNGHVLSGKILMKATLDLDTKTKEITHTYDGFMVDDVSVSGTSTITRIRENEDGNPEMTTTFEKTLTWSDGEAVTRAGTKRRVWVEGYNNNGWGDNVYLTWGDWSTTFKDGTTYTTVISTDNPLRREFSCKYIVSGEMYIDKGEKKGTINFGDGSCDDKATFTPEDGESEEFTLRKRKRNK